MIEYSKRNKIRKERYDDTETSFFWPSGNRDRVFRNEIVVNRVRNGELESFPFQARKSKWVSKKNPLEC